MNNSRGRDETKAAFTIVSNNYLAHARALAQSFMKFHAEIPFFVVLVDSYQNEHHLPSDHFSVIPYDELPIPARGYFEYQYDVMELNTAVKPFAFKYLFGKGFDQVVYFDPDIYVFSPLIEIFGVEQKTDAILIPHIQSAYYDQAHPNDLNILQSGTYNLGFLSLCQSPNSARFLHWWSEKLFTDCVVDIPNGLFVDQKWVDFGPAMMDCQIMRHPGYNVAYWNLHEKDFEKDQTGYSVNGQELAFFHFSGFSSDNPERLSKHENRFKDKVPPVVQELCRLYASELKRCLIDEVKDAPYRFNNLSNGIRLCHPIRRVIRDCLKRGLDIPSPKDDPDAFGRFITTPNPLINGNNVAPIVTKLLENRYDVRTAFPDAATNKDDPAFLSWFEHSFSAEYKQSQLVQKFAINLASSNGAEKIISTYESREDLQKVFPDAFRSSKGFRQLVEWCHRFGIAETAISTEDIAEFESARSGGFRVLDIYFARPDLLGIFMSLHKKQVQDEFFDWLKVNLITFDRITNAEITFFNQIIRSNREWLICASLLYNPVLRRHVGGATIFAIDEISRYLSSTGGEDLIEGVEQWLTGEMGPDPLMQLHFAHQNDPWLSQCVAKPFESRKNLINLFNIASRKLSAHSAASRYDKWLSYCRKRVETYNPNKFDVNILGYFNTPTGMGQSARTLADIFSSSDTYSCNTYTFPCPWYRKEHRMPADESPSIYGTPSLEAASNIWVANADEFSRIQAITSGLTHNCARRIGYWVWETESFPDIYVESSASVDEVWTPSEFCAESFSKKLALPVKVVPHCYTMPANIQPESDIISDLGLGKKLFVVGFIFDVKSCVERKNPRGVINAFLRAFPEDKNVRLVLKVSGQTLSDFEYQMVKAEYKDERIVWIEKTIPYRELVELFNRFDAYLSLHRSEGFGLTMLEAMGCEVPVIGTAYSGNVQFMSEENSFPIEFKSKTSDRSYGPYPRGTKWAEPDIDQAAIRLAVLKSDSKLASKKVDLARTTVERFTPKAVSEYLATALSYTSSEPVAKTKITRN